MRFEYSSGRGSCSLTHNLATGKAEHPGACDDEGPPPLPCCERSRWGQHETACPQRAIPHLFVVSIEPDDVDPGMVDVRAFKPFKVPVTLDDIKQETKLSKMVLVNNSRLSVQPVTAEEWKLICKMGGIKP